jgi:hypothetical protein
MNNLYKPVTYFPSHNVSLHLARYKNSAPLSVTDILQDDLQVPCVHAFISHHLAALVDLANF